MSLLCCCINNRSMNTDDNKYNTNSTNNTSNDDPKLLEFYNKLKTINNPKDIDYFSFKGQIFYAKHCNIYDGDTFSIIFEYNGEFIKYKCRCMGYDSPEIKPSLNNPNREYEKEIANKAKNRLEELLNKHETKLVKIECLDFDKYGRLLVYAWNMVDKTSINQIMIEEGHGKVYFGKKKEKW